jgi:hypothetical protein
MNNNANVGKIRLPNGTEAAVEFQELWKMWSQLPPGSGSAKFIEGEGRRVFTALWERAMADRRAAVDALLQREAEQHERQRQAERENHSQLLNDQRIERQRVIRGERWNTIDRPYPVGVFNEQLIEAIPHAELVSQIKRGGVLPQIEGNALRVSSFSDWVLSLYRQIPRRQSDLAEGLRAERIVEPLRERIAAIWKGAGKWHKESCGLAASDSTTYRIPSLLIGGKAMVAKPDYLFRNRQTGAAVIVEIKCTSAKLREECWPNVRAQLWAYSKIEQLADAPEVILIAEIWGKRGYTFRGRYIWKRGEPRLEMEAKELFDAYSAAALGSWLVHKSQSEET